MMKKIPFYESNFSVPDIPQKSLYSQRIRNLNVEKNRLSVLIAPAGFGKTTAVLLSLREHRARIKWYRMNREDAVLQVWYHHLITALFASPGPFQEGEENSMSMLAGITDIRGNYPLLNAQIVQDAYALCENSDERVYLVLDDFHYAADNDVIVETVQYLAANMPQCVSVVVTSRRDPKIISGRLALRDDVRRITASELLFTKEEAVSLIKDVYGLKADSSQIDAVFNRTEGWIAGLYILCRSENLSDEDMEAIGTDKKGEELFSLVLSKYLRDIDPGSRRIIMKLSVLEDFSCGELASVMKLKDAEGFVKWLEGGNFYIQKIPTEPPRYRFHALFREELLKLFESTFGAEERAAYLKELSVYYRDANPRLTVRFYLMGRFEEALTTARECSREFFDTGMPEKMFMLMGEFPQDMIDSDPYLMLFSGMLHINSDSALALNTFMKAIESFRKRGDLSFLMNTFGMLLVTAYQHNNFVLLEKAYKRLPVISLLAEGGDTRKKLIISFFIAMTGQDRLSAARMLLRLLDRRRISDDMWDFSYAMIRGIYFYRCGDLELSAANLDRIISHPVGLRNDQWRIIGLVSCCNVPFLRMDFGLIQRFADEFFLLGEKYDSAFASGYGYFMLAYLKYGKCDIPGALKAIDDSIEAFSKYGGDLLVKEGMIIRSLWNERESDERTIRELEYIRAALNEEKTGHGLQELAMTALGVTYKRMGRFDDGYAMLTEALASVRKIGAKQSICGLYLQLADLFLRKGDKNAAAEYAALFAGLVEQGGYTYWREADILAVRSVYGLLSPECRMKPLFRKISDTYGCEPNGCDAGEDREPSKVVCKLFGEFSVSCGGTRLCEGDFKTRKVSGILKYILTLANGDVVSRERLAAVFWPDANSKAAFASLRVALYELRKSLSSAEISFENENALIVERREGFAVNTDITVERDTDTLEKMYRRYRRNEEEGRDGDAPNVFDPRETDGEYQFLDQIPPDEFAFFKDSIPVLYGSVFAGWQVVLANGLNALGEPADYTYGPLLLTPGTADGHYSIIFTAVWSIMPPHAPVDVKISFDLKGGAEPKGYEGIFATRNMTMPYAPDSMAPESEFAFFKGIKPVKEGFDFEGWRFDVYDSDANILAVSNAYYVFDAIHLPAGNYNGYEIKFEANWEKTKTAQPKPESPGNVITGDDSRIYKWLTVGLASAAGAVLMIAAVGSKRRSRAK